MVGLSPSNSPLKTPLKNRDFGKSVYEFLKLAERKKNTRSEERKKTTEGKGGKARKRRRRSGGGEGKLEKGVRKSGGEVVKIGYVTNDTQIPKNIRAKNTQIPLHTLTSEMQ